MLNITIVITCYRLLSPCYVPREVSHSFYNNLLNAYYKVVREAVNKTGKNIPALRSSHFRQQTNKKVNLCQMVVNARDKNQEW